MTSCIKQREQVSPTQPAVASSPKRSLPSPKEPPVKKRLVFLSEEKTTDISTHVVEKINSSCVPDFVPNVPLPWRASTPALEQEVSPEIPQKKSKQVCPYEKQYKAMESGCFYYKGKSYKTVFLAEGAYSAAFKIVGVIPLIEGVDNSKIVVKVFHGKNSEFGETKLNDYLRHSLQNYKAAIDSGLFVAKIYNAETALEDHCVIQEAIANPIDCKNTQQLEKIKEFLDKRQTIQIDAQPHNFREEKGEVYLIDFLEEPEDVTINLKTTLNSWIELFHKTFLQKEIVREKLGLICPGTEEISDQLIDQYFALQSLLESSLD
jgi:hypothetical protein